MRITELWWRLEQTFGAAYVASVAREFSGGGHINAAGCSFESTPEEAEALLVEGMKACLASC